MIQRPVVPLSQLTDGQEAVCFAMLANKTRGVTKRNEPFVKCYFRDRVKTLEAPIWASHKFIHECERWNDGMPYRLVVRAEQKANFGLQLDLLEIRPAEEGQDAADGFQISNLVESSRYGVRLLEERVHNLIDRYITDAYLNRLVKLLLEQNRELFLKMPAASAMHHSYTNGLLEHVWSMSRTAAFVADHYARYYEDLNPPINVSMVVASTILHDIGKIRELSYHPVEAKYTTVGYLVGHVLLGRDMVREAACQIDGFPEETLLLLEHSILAHHGKREFGAPVLPQTIEALIVSYIDDIDAKINAVARERLRSSTDGDFTDKVYALDNRKIYKGIPIPAPEPSDLDF
ncbi:MAG: HD domain-containing protein [Isosphaeraceae bacterium]